MNLGVSLPEGRGGSALQWVLLYLFSGDSRQNQSVVTVGGVVLQFLQTLIVLFSYTSSL